MNAFRFCASLCFSCQDLLFTVNWKRVALVQSSPFVERIHNGRLPRVKVF
uniref:Uncharacterized protein n=1 Tax=Anguilla anguilla TaxID=7936 RepID=A0A0E9WI98_ANGAN